MCILGATTFQISNRLASTYPGSGGSDKIPGVKIQLEYDLLSGQFIHVEVGSGKQNGANYEKNSRHCRFTRFMHTKFRIFEPY
ncbi:TPA: transposase [Bacillus toyonensis]|nr:transposase [Bacillus toyonensis]